MALNPFEFEDGQVYPGHDPHVDETVLRCPGCERWQLHYTADSVIDLLEWKKGKDGLLHADYSKIEALIEHLIARHVQMECRHPEIVYKLWKRAGRQQR